MSARQSFVAALQDGRARTAAGEYAAALSAFDRALAAMPEHPRALSGRGYAHLRAGELDAAEADLEAALRRGGPRKLRAAVLYNLGLLFKARGRADLAEKYFRRSNQLRPTRAAAAAACDVDGSGDPGEAFADWPALHGELREWDGEDEPYTCTIDPAAPCFGACEGDPPWLVSRCVPGGTSALVAPLPDGRLQAVVFPYPFGAPCHDAHCDTDIELVRDGDLARYTMTRAEWGPDSFDCEDADAFDGCEDSSWSTWKYQVDWLLATRPPRVIAEIRREFGTDVPPVTVTLAGDRFRVHKEGCTLELPAATQP